MESTLNIQKRKQSSDVVFEKCIICQKVRTGKDLRAASSKGLASFKEAYETRSKYKCEQYTDLLNSAINFDSESQTLKWHKDCFSGFTSPHHLQRLKRKFDNANAPSPCQTAEKSASRFVSRSSLPRMQWDKCMFCQSPGGALSQVQTLETSAKILIGSKNDLYLQYRLAGISDLVAAEGKYHLKCYSKFVKQQSSNENAEECSDCGLLTLNQACLNTVIDELEAGLEKGNIYSVQTVWNRYCELVTATQPAALSSVGNGNELRRFRRKIEDHFGDKIELIAQERNVIPY